MRATQQANGGPGGGRGISRGARPGVARPANQRSKKCRKFPKIKRRFVSAEIHSRTPVRKKLRFFIHLDAFFSRAPAGRDLLQYTRAQAVPWRDRDATVSGAAAPHLYDALRTRVRTLKNRRRGRSRRDLVAPRPARLPPPFFFFDVPSRPRADWAVSPDDTKYLRPAGVHAETRRTPERSPMSNPALSSASMSSALATLAAPAASAAAAPAPRVNADEHPS